MPSRETKLKSVRARAGSDDVDVAVGGHLQVGVGAVEGVYDRVDVAVWPGWRSHDADHVENRRDLADRSLKMHHAGLVGVIARASRTEPGVRRPATGVYPDPERHVCGRVADALEGDEGVVGDCGWARADEVELAVGGHLQVGVGAVEGVHDRVDVAVWPGGGGQDADRVGAGPAGAGLCGGSLQVHVAGGVLVPSRGPGPEPGTARPVQRVHADRVSGTTGPYGSAGRCGSVRGRGQHR